MRISGNSQQAIEAYNQLVQGQAQQAGGVAESARSDAAASSPAVTVSLSGSYPNTKAIEDLAAQDPAFAHWAKHHHEAIKHIAEGDVQAIVDWASKHQQQAISALESHPEIVQQIATDHPDFVKSVVETAAAQHPAVLQEIEAKAPSLVSLLSPQTAPITGSSDASGNSPASDSSSSGVQSTPNA